MTRAVPAVLVKQSLNKGIFWFGVCLPPTLCVCVCVCVCRSRCLPTEWLCCEGLVVTAIYLFMKSVCSFLKLFQNVELRRSRVCRHAHTRSASGDFTCACIIILLIELPLLRLLLRSLCALSLLFISSPLVCLLSVIVFSSSLFYFYLLYLIFFFCPHPSSVFFFHLSSSPFSLLFLSFPPFSSLLCSSSHFFPRFSYSSLLSFFPLVLCCLFCPPFLSFLLSFSSFSRSSSPLTHPLSSSFLASPLLLSPTTVCFFPLFLYSTSPPPLLSFFTSLLLFSLSCIFLSSSIRFSLFSSSLLSFAAFILSPPPLLSFLSSPLLQSPPLILPPYL